MAPSASAAFVASCLLCALCWTSAPMRVCAKPVEMTPKYGIVIQFPAEFVKVVPLGANGQPLLDLEALGGGGAGERLKGEGGGSRRSFPSLFLSDADAIFGPTFTSHSMSKKVRSKSSYQTSDMAMPKESQCEAYCALKKDNPS